MLRYLSERLQTTGSDHRSLTFGGHITETGVDYYSLAGNRARRS